MLIFIGETRLKIDIFRFEDILDTNIHAGFRGEAIRGSEHPPPLLGKSVANY